MRGKWCGSEPVAGCQHVTRLPGGCPFAPGAPGNLASEKLLALLDGLNIETGVDRDAVEQAVAELKQVVPSIGSSHRTG